MKKILDTREFLEIAADTYVRGDDHRAGQARKPVMEVTRQQGNWTFYEPPEDYLDQLWGPSFTPAQAELYRGVIEQLHKAVLDGQLPTHSWPMYIVSTPTQTDIDTGRSVVDLGEFQKWAKKNTPQARKDWLQLILDATEPAGAPVQLPAPATEIAQPRKKRDGALKLPTRAMLDKYTETMPFGENVGLHQAAIAFAKWLVTKEYFAGITERTIENWFQWNNVTLKLVPTQEAIDRGFETNGVENS